MIISYLWKTFKLVFFVIVLILITRTLVVETGRVNGVSMEPTYLDNQVFLVNKFRLLFFKPERGQIIQCKHPQNGALLIKRVIGLPGEQIHIRDNNVYITDTSGNTFILNEPYLGQNMITQSADLHSTDYPILDPDQYFVLGDNRRESGDSRRFGPVSREQILGSVMTWF